MSSQTQVRELFSLPKKEVIFDDFGCAYSKGILHQGRMYITENYICFFSSIMGISQKLIIPLNDVTKITKAKRLGMIKSLKIYQANKKNSHSFQSFSDTDKTYSIIYKLWTNVSTYAQGLQDEVQSEEDNEPEDQAGLPRGSNVQNIEKSTSVEVSQGSNPKPPVAQDEAQNLLTNEVNRQSPQLNTGKFYPQLTFPIQQAHQLSHNLLFKKNKNSQILQLLINFQTTSQVKTSPPMVPLSQQQSLFLYQFNVQFLFFLPPKYLC